MPAERQGERQELEAWSSQVRRRATGVWTWVKYQRSRGALRQWTLWALGGLAVLSAAWIVVTGLIVRQDADKVRDLLARIQVQVSQGDLAGAQRTAADIPAIAERVHRLTTGPAWWSASQIPYFGRPFDIMRSATSVADEIGQHGVPALLQVASELDPARLRTGPGAINLEPLTKAAPALNKAAALLNHEVSRLDALPRSSWLHQVDSVRSSLETTLRSVSGYVSAGARTAQVLPHLLGRDGPQRYFIALQNESEMRGTGGLPGAFAIAVADHGTVRFTDFAADDVLQPAATGQLIRTGLDFGPDYRAMYRASGPTDAFVNSNLSPNFPYAARIWAAMWEKRTGQHVDAALALDPQVLANFLSATGPVQTPQHVSITTDNAVALTEQLEYSLYPDNARRQAFLVDVLHAVANRVLDGSANAGDLVRAMSLSASEHRVLAWSEDPSIESRIEQTNYAGVIPDDSRPFVGVVLNNAAAGKLDYYLGRRLQYERVGCGSIRDMVVTITLRNSAPASGLPGYVAGRLDHPDGPTRPGDNRTLLDYFATAGAELTSVTIDGKQATAAVLQDRGHPVYRFDLELPRGAARQVVLHLSEPAGSGPLQVWQQPGVTPLVIQGVEQPCP